MRIVGLLGVVFGFIISLLLLSFIICAFVLNGDFDYERKRKNNK